MNEEIEVRRSPNTDSIASFIDFEGKMVDMEHGGNTELDSLEVKFPDYKRLHQAHAQLVNRQNPEPLPPVEDVPLLRGMDACVVGFGWR